MFKGVFSSLRFVKFQTLSKTSYLCPVRATAARSPNATSGIAKMFYTSPKRQLNPVVALVLRHISRTISVFSGKVFRSWWKGLTHERKEYYKRKYFFNPLFWGIPAGVLTIGGGAFYISHLQTAPITNRKRFIAFNKEQMEELSDMNMKSVLEEAQGKIIAEGDRTYVRIKKIIDRLIQSNEDIEEVKSHKWTVHIIEDNTENVFVLPNGHIFVYTGILRLTKNDDQLAVILGHEMAHAVLSHGAEKISFAGVINILTVVGLALIWALLPGDVLPKLVEKIQDKVYSIMLELPYSRVTELEADKVGLLFISKACFDVRESSILWRNWAALSTMQNEEETPEFLSTHPSHKNRAEELDKMIPEAVEKRKDCKCPELKGTLEKVDINFLKSLVKDTKPPEQNTAPAALVKGSHHVPNT